MEIYTDDNGNVILKKYSPIGELGDFAKQYAEALAQTSGNIVCITDREKIIAVAGGMKKELAGKEISNGLEKIINERSCVTAARGDKNYVMITGEDNFSCQIICPIICEGDVIGSVIIASGNEKNGLGETEYKMAGFAALFLGKQMEL